MAPLSYLISLYCSLNNSSSERAECWAYVWCVGERVSLQSAGGVIGMVALLNWWKWKGAAVSFVCPVDRFDVINLLCGVPLMVQLRVGRSVQFELVTTQKLLTLYQL
jgi:hypothetical protein